jgi:hypothetical protein
MPLYPMPALIKHFYRLKFEQAAGICPYRWAKAFHSCSLTDLSCKSQEETAQPAFSQVRASTDHIVPSTDHPPIYVSISPTPKGSTDRLFAVGGCCNLSPRASQ